MDKTHHLRASIQIREVNNITRTTIVIDDRFHLLVGAMTEVWDRTTNEKVHSSRNCTEAMKWVAKYYEAQHGPTTN